MAPRRGGSRPRTDPFHNRMNNSSQRNTLSSEEWDFKGIPKSELWICWNYEFAREAVRMEPRLLETDNRMEGPRA